MKIWGQNLARRAVEEGVRAVLEEVGHEPGFIFNLGHGIHKETPVENVQALVDAVRAFRPGSAPPG